VAKPYIVGERGPELFVPSRNGHIVPNNKLGGKGGGINVYVTGNTISSKMDLRDIALEIGEELMRQYKMQTRTSY
jgi:hypothetical protein